MKYRKQLANGDYSFGNNIQDFYTGQEAIAQAIKTKILLFYGEWWEDISQGIPMFFRRHSAGCGQMYRLTSQKR